jgi:hypothetical protein
LIFSLTDESCLAQSNRLTGRAERHIMPNGGFMVYRGQIRGGVVILEAGAELPDGTTVIVQAAVCARGVPRVRPADTLDADQMERIDRLLGSLSHSTDEAMAAQQRLDRYL